MGGGSLPNTITFQQNPPRVFNDPLSNFPQFTKESFDEWITDTCNNIAPGFTEASLNYLVSFDAPWQVIGSGVLKDLSNIDISNNKSLTEIFDHKGALTDICSSAFENMGLSGGLDFSGFSAKIHFFPNKTVIPSSFAIKIFSCISYASISKGRS